MERAKKERWMELCEQAADEKDSQRLLKLTTEIDKLLTEALDRVESVESKDFGPAR